VSFHSHNKYRLPVHFRLDLPRIDPLWAMLIEDVAKVRALGGDIAVRAFITEWRKRGHLVCSDEDAERLISGEEPL
jgi:hypothetical protein